MQTPKLCVTVTAPTMAELRARRDAVTGADLVELRLDTVDRPDVAGALRDRRLPVIVTCRAAWEGGSFRGSEDERRRLLSEAQHAGAEFIDVEFAAGFDDLVAHRQGRGVIVSCHDFASVPADLAARVAAMRATGAEVVKMAVMAHTLSDTLALLPLAASDAANVFIAMGEAGLATRVLAARFGSCWTYAGDEVAPGQIPALRLRDEFGFGRITRATALYGVVGRPIMHSLSPAMHNAAFRAAGHDAVYLPLAAASFDDFLCFADALALCGASVTAPFKRAALAIASLRDPGAAATGAANTLRRGAGGWEACNTDIAGFLAPLAPVEKLAGLRVTILGAGGAARATVFALSRAGARVTIAARRADAAAELAETFGASVSPWPPPVGSWDLLVNTTPVGTTPAAHASPLPAEALTGQTVYDLVYNPPETRLLADARAAGCRAIGGLDMLVAQAEAQFTWWTDTPPPSDVMRTAARARVHAAAACPTPVAS